MSRATIFTVPLLLAACARPPPPSGAAGPVEAVQAFATAISEGKASAAWAMLSARTQREADALAQRARKSSGAAKPETGRQMLFGAGLPGGKVTAREVSHDGGAAEVEVTEAGKGARTYRAVREGALWKVELRF